MEQGTTEWFQARLGKLTASRIADATARTKTGWGAARENLMAELAIERLTGAPYDSYQSPAMLRGNELEPLARETYEFEANTTVEQVGFVDHPELEQSGASPYGLVGTDGLVEIKCPNTATHIKTLNGASIAKVYRCQMQWQMACTGRQWCDFVSFDDRLPLNLQFHVQRVERDDKLIGELTEAAVVFLGELNEMVDKLKAR